MYRKILILLMTMMFLVSCATPKAIDIVQANDETMSCNELKLAIHTASLNEDLAHSDKGLTSENILSGLFFFPAYFVTYGTSIHAEYNASERKDHLLKLYSNNGCAKPRGEKYQKLVSDTLDKLEKLKVRYVKGYIDEEQYLIERKQMLIGFD